MTQETWQKHSQRPLIVAAFVFLAAYSILVIAQPPEPSADALMFVIWLTWAAFGIDYIVKLMLAPRRGRWFLRHPMDLLIVVIPAARPLLLLRPLRLRKVMDRAPGTAIRARVMAYVVASAVLLLYTVALSVLSFERGAPGANITSMGDSLWWAVVTITTVGYGDLYPVTVPGRLAASALMIGGFVVLGMVTAVLSSWVIESVTAATSSRTKAPHDRSAHSLNETKIKHPTVEERAAKGKDRREKTPVSSHAGRAPAPDRPDPVALLEEQNLTREKTWYRCVTAGCWSRRSRSTGVQPRSWPPT
ncbi:potassium channel family protein [Arthrobacter sp. 9MFCol3.1]|uniref:potassium channel family protein n=1 Tax=Arthrobacter sp. 9MFCol3.1 TaxID=1150398 RepID=UPI000A65F407|nr:potassium channel family protein [Arthrobacter sp. 9MFCol3.1]